MLDPNHPIAKLAKSEGRYHEDAYTFVFDALNHAQTVLGMGAASCRHEAATEPELYEAEAAGYETEGSKAANAMDRHLTGQELCRAIQHLATEQYGYMAKCVLNRWGVTSTTDFGNIVFSLIEVGQMRKTESDCRKDFDDVFDFGRDLVDAFEITQPE